MCAGDHAQGQAGLEFQLAAVAIGTQVSGVGDGQRAIGKDSRAEAGGEAGRRIQIGTSPGDETAPIRTWLRWSRTVAGSWDNSLRSAPTSVLEFMAACRPLPLTSPTTISRESSLQREHLKEVAAHALNGEVGAFKHEIAVGRQRGGNQQRLHAARGGNLGRDALLLLADADEPVENYRDQAAKKNRIGDGRRSRIRWGRGGSGETQILAVSTGCSLRNRERYPAEFAAAARKKGSSMTPLRLDRNAMPRKSKKQTSTQKTTSAATESTS